MPEDYENFFVRADLRLMMEEGATCATCWSEIADFAKYKREFFEKYIQK